MVFLLGVPLVISLGVVIEPMVNLIPMPLWIEKLFQDMIKPDIFSFLTVVIAAPVFEEMIFRGVLLKSMLQRYSPGKAIFWSSFIFGVIHLNPWQFLGALVIGMIIGWTYWKTDSLWPCIFLHLVNNLYGFFMMLYSGITGITFENLRTHPGILKLYLAAIPVLLISGFLLHKKLASQKPDNF